MALRLNWCVVGAITRSVNVFWPSGWKPCTLTRGNSAACAVCHHVGRETERGEVEPRGERPAIHIAAVQAVAHVDEEGRADDVVVVDREAVRGRERGPVTTGGAGRILEAVERQAALIRPRVAHEHPPLVVDDMVDARVDAIAFTRRRAGGRVVARLGEGVGGRGVGLRPVLARARPTGLIRLAGIRLPGKGSRMNWPGLSGSGRVVAGS